jgi:hypothetical protein
MAKKPFISVDGITVGEANALVNVILANGDITTSNITVSNNANLGNVGNVIITGGSSGYVLSTNGSGNLNWVAQSGGGSSNISNGNSNVNIATANGNVTISVAGTSNVVNVTGSNVFVTANIIPTANITYDLGTSTNRFRDLYLSGNTINLGNSNLSANGTQLILTNPLGGEFIVGGNGIVNSADLTGYSIANGNSNVSVVANGNIAISSAGNANILIVTGTGANINGTLGITSNITAGNANLGNLATANFFTGNGSLLTGITAGTANTSNTVTASAQPNITSVGTLTSLAVSGTTNLGAVGNITITGGNANSYLRTDGSGSLSWNALPTTTVTVDSFNGDGTTTAFTLSVTPTSKAYTSVTIGGVSQYQSSYTVTGTTITFSSAPPSGTVIEVQTIASGGSATPITINTIGGSAYVGVSANTTMVAGNVYIVNTSSANLTMTLPASGSLGDSIGIIDGTGDANIHAITVGRNGGNIMGSATDMIITTPRAGLTMVYYNSTQGWILTQV